MMNLTEITDALYGECTLDAELAELIRSPIVQRLREVRLSNIDSICMPGVANISRYEHSIGVAMLASKLGFQSRLSAVEMQIIQAAALLHDTAIPPFGHLVEEAMQYCSLPFNHENRWQQIFASETNQLGGIDCQLYHGRQAGIRKWAERLFKEKGGECLKSIFELIQGKGTYGCLICGSLDLDNLDNVVRAAFHIGLDVNRELPERIASAILGITNGRVILNKESLPLIDEWLQLREKLYARFMLSRADFVGKTMLLYSTVAAITSRTITETDWTLTDREFLTRLLNTNNRDIVKPVESWMCCELWPLSDLIWLDGKAPPFSSVLEFSNKLSSFLDRRCFAYRIKDKRTRKVQVATTSGEVMSLGYDSSRWLLGVCGVYGKDFTREENREIARMAATSFQSMPAGTVRQVTESAESESLLNLV